MISVALLGPVEVRRDGQLLAIPTGRTTELLMRLAVAAGTMVSRERLLEDVWADEAMSTRNNTVQSMVSRLRRALGDPALIVGGQIGYTLAIDPGSVDALDIVRRADQVTALRQAGDPAAALDACSAALALFRAESLFDANDAEWLRPFRSQAEELRLRLVEDSLGARVDLGATGEIVAELQELVAAHPLREGLWALLITALYRDGRQADALAAYRSVREHLVEELGLEPGRELQRLEQQVLEHDHALDAPAAPMPPLTRSAEGGNLPPLSSTLVGRMTECAEVADLVATKRLVTLVGPAGVGKTRLALEVARGADAADGAWLVRLESARTDPAVGDVVADSLNASGSSEAALVERLRGADILIVLDNCEHVLDSAADLVGTLLRAGSGVRVLATSQVPLGMDGERVYSVDPLEFTDAVTLFAERAGDAGQGVLDSDERDTLEAVCRSLDGLPLAIELAAARTKSLSLPEISRRLSDRFSLLRDPTGRRPERQRTLAAAVGWSYDLLFPDDQRGLWAVACFVGGAPLDGVEAVLHALGVPDEAAVDVVGRLVDRSLVTVERRDDGSVRYWLLDSVRAYAFDRLAESGEGPAALAAHAGWVATAAAQAERGATGPGQPLHIDFARTERANIDAALEWAALNDPVLGLTIACGFGWVWIVLGDVQGAQRLSASLAAADGLAPRELQVEGLLLLGWLDAAAGDVEQGHTAVNGAIEQLPDLDDRATGARADLFLAYVLSQKGEFAEALRLLERSRLVFAEVDRGWEQSVSWVLTAHIGVAAGDPAAAVQACAEATRLLAEVGDPWLIVHMEAMLGGVAQSDRRFSDACDHFGRAAEASSRQGFASAEAYHLANLGRAEQQLGDLEKAVGTLRRAVDTARAAGDLRVATLARLWLAQVLRRRGDAHEAFALAREAQGWYLASGGGDQARLADCLVAAMDETRAPTDTDRRLETVLTQAREAGDREVEVLALDALARRQAENGDLEQALAFLGDADAVMAAGGHRLVDADRVDANWVRSASA